VTAAPATTDRLEVGTVTVSRHPETPVASIDAVIAREILDSRER